MSRFKVEVTERMDRRHAADAALSCTVVDAPAGKLPTSCTIVSCAPAAMQCTLIDSVNQSPVAATQCTIVNSQTAPAAMQCTVVDGVAPTARAAKGGELSPLAS